MKGRFKEALGEESDSEEEDSGNSGDDKSQKDKPISKKAKKGIQLEELQEAGFASGPSILNIREQPPDLSYKWGRGTKSGEDEEEDFEERERMRNAAGEATRIALQQSLEQKKKVDEALLNEKIEHSNRQKDRRETFQQREKRKRELGQAKKATNYVEEEKRLLRQHNVYSGFD